MKGGGEGEIERVVKGRLRESVLKGRWGKDGEGEGKRVGEKEEGERVVKGRLRERG